MKVVKERWYYGWTIVLAATVITLVTVGIRMGIGPFFLPMLNDFEMSRTSLSLIVATGMFVYGVGMPLAGYAEKRFGTRIVLLCGASIVFLACLWTINATTTTSLMFSFGILLSLGLAFTGPVALTPIITRWFIRRRGQALFYLSTGSMAGIAIMTPVLTYLIETFSWQQTLFMFAILFVLLIVPVALFIIHEDVPEGADQQSESETNLRSGQTPAQQSEEHAHLSFKEAVKTWPFWAICIGLFACGYSMNLLGSHGVPMLSDHGFSNFTASMAIGLIGLVAIPSTIILGNLSDRLSRKNMLSLIYFVRGIGFLLLVGVTIAFQLYFIAFIAGFVWAGSIALSSAILSDVYGVKLVGILYGWAYFSHQIGSTISSLLGGWGYETFHTHWVSFGSAVLVLFIASWVSFKIPKKLHIEKKVIHEKQMLTEV